MKVLESSLSTTVYQPLSVVFGASATFVMADSVDGAPLAPRLVAAVLVLWARVGKAG